MPREKIDLVGPGIKVHSVSRHGAVIIQAEHVGPEVGFHSLRHTYVSLHAERGTPQAVVQAIGGHGTPSMTTHYTHIGEETARRVAGVLDISGEEAGSGQDALQAPLPEWAKKKVADIHKFSRVRLPIF